MSELKVVGTAVPRAEGSDKVSGRTLYAADVNLPGTLWAKILRSPHPHARILNIDVSKAQRIRGVKAILTGSEVQGHLIGKQIRDMPVLCWDRVRFVGDRVAAVAAESVDAAQEAVNVIDVDYESLAAVFDPLEAMQLSAPRLHDDVTVYDGGPKDKLAADLHNGLTRLAYKKGDVEKGFREADLVLEHVFHIPGRHQGYLEPHAALVAIDPDGRIQVWISAKNPFGVRSQLAKCLQLPEERIRINVVNVGGEFGGKGDGIDLPIAYFLSQRTGRPVKIVMTYAEELSASNPAHPTVITVGAASSAMAASSRASCARCTPAAPTARLNPTRRSPPGTTPVGNIASTMPISNTCKFTRIRFPAVTTAAQGRWPPPSPSTLTPILLPKN